MQDQLFIRKKSLQKKWFSSLRIASTFLLIMNCTNIANSQEKSLRQNEFNRPIPDKTFQVNNSGSYPPIYGISFAYFSGLEYFDEKSVKVTVDKVNKRVNINILVYITNPDNDEETYGKGEYVNVWIDWDGSGRFDDNEEVNENVLARVQYASIIGFKGTLPPYSASVKIPDDAVTNTWYRVSLRYGSDPLPVDIWTWGSTLTKSIILPGKFRVMDKTPIAGAVNVDWEKPNITATFSEPFDPATLNSGTVKLEWRNDDGHYQTVAGNIKTIGDRRFRFVPNNPLIDGIKYRVTLKSGDTGIKDKSVPANKLDKDIVWNFSTMLNFESGNPEGNGIIIRALQVIQDNDLVPNKATLVRTSPLWFSKPNVHSDDQVKEFWANITVEDGSGHVLSMKSVNPRNDVLIKEAYGDKAVQRGEEFFNFFGWYPTGSGPQKVVVKYEPVPQPTTPPRVFTETKNVNLTSRAPNLNVEYKFLRVNGPNTSDPNTQWQNQVPKAIASKLQQVMSDGAVYTNQTFPVVHASMISGGEVRIPPLSFTKTQNGVPFVKVRMSGTEKEMTAYRRLSMDLFKSWRNAGFPHNKRVIVGLIPTGFLGDALGIRLSAGANQNVVLLNSDATATTLTHELGHAYGLAHQDVQEIDGYKLSLDGRTGWIKSVGNLGIRNPEAGGSPIFPLMLKTADEEATFTNSLWITKPSYQQLLGAGLPMSSPPPEILLLTNSTEQELIAISGFVQDSTAALIESVSSGPSLLPALPAAGRYTLEQVDAAGNQLIAVEFEPFTIGQDTAGHEISNFNIILPDQPSASKLRLSYKNQVLVERERSANEPSLQILAPVNGASVQDQLNIEWQAADTDGDTLYFDVYYTPDGADWTMLCSRLSEANLSVDTQLINQGSIPMVLVCASDGFNVSQDTVSFTLQNSAAVLAKAPSDSAVDVPMNQILTVQFRDDMTAAQFDANSMQLRDSKGAQIQGEIYQPDTRRLIFSPGTLLMPSSQYTATIAQELQNVYGNQLASEVVWSFTTEADNIPPQIVRVHPANGSGVVSPTSWVQVFFNEDMEAGSLTSTNLSVSIEGGGLVDGTVSYDPQTKSAILKPSARLTLGTTYIAKIDTLVQDSAGNQLEQARSWHFTTSSVMPPKASFTGHFQDYAEDTNGDGFYDFLNIEVGVNISGYGRKYIVQANLTDSSGAVIVSAEADLRLDPGDAVALLSFNGVRINQHRTNGSYFLKDLNLYYSYDTAWPLLDQRSTAFQTRNYKKDIFQVGAAQLTGTFADFGEDIDGNSLFDSLSIQVEVLVAEEGSYRLDGSLFDSQGFFIEKDRNKQYLNTGLQNIELSFDGRRIRGHGETSPYRLRYLSLLDNKNKVIVSIDDAYVTTSYDPTQFETSPADLFTLISEVTLFDKFEDDSLVTIGAQIFNFGAEKADSVAVRFAVDNTQIGADQVLTKVSGANPGMAYVEWELKGISPDTHNVAVTVDPENLIPEIDENNNDLSFDISLPLTFPFTPEKLAAETDATGALLSWTPVAEMVTGYNIYRSLVSGGEYDLMNQSLVETSTFLDTSLTPVTDYFYRVTSIKRGFPNIESAYSQELRVTTQPTAIDDHRIHFLPTAFELFPNYPNPFNPETTIRFNVPFHADMTISIYNILGQKVNELLNQRIEAGRHAVVWYGRDQSGVAVSSGVYLVKMQTSEGSRVGFVKVRKMVMIK